MKNLPYIPQDMTLVNNSSNALACAKARAFAKQIGASLNDVQPYVVTIYKELSPNASQYTFEFDDKSFDNNRRLVEQDAFIANGLSISLLKATVSATTQKPLIANARRYNHPDPTVFVNGPVSTLTEAECLQSVYGGFMDIGSDQDVRVSGLSTRMFRFDPTENTAATLSESSPIFTSVAPFVFRGGQRNYVTLSMVDEHDAIQDPSPTKFRNFLVLEVFGYRIQGAANKVTVADMRGAGRYN